MIEHSLVGVVVLLQGACGERSDLVHVVGCGNDLDYAAAGLEDTVELVVAGRREDIEHGRGNARLKRDSSKVRHKPSDAVFRLANSS